MFSFEKLNRFSAAWAAAALALILTPAACNQVAPIGGTTEFTQVHWTGAVSDSSARVVARLRTGHHSLQLEYAATEDFSSGAQVLETSKLVASPNGYLAHFQLVNLRHATRYWYRFRIGDSIDTASVSSFTTFPSDGSAGDFSFVFGSCQRTGSNSEVYDKMLRHDPLFMMVTGDFHYGNISANNVERFYTAWQSGLLSPRLSSFYAQVPIAYMWDDHDFGPNDSDSTSPARAAALTAYRDMVPHYPLASDSGLSPVQQAFSVGRVRFILLDLRSARSPYRSRDDDKTMLGVFQKQWLYDEIERAASTHDLIVWVSSVPWIDDRYTSDGWTYFRRERRELTEFVIKHNLQNRMCMLCGDAHMLAIDDGSHSFNSDAEGPGFPVMHAAALDRGGSVKGGPYSHGSKAGGGQFGLMDVKYTATTLDVSWRGYNLKDEVVMSYEFSVERRSPADGE